MKRFAVFTGIFSGLLFGVATPFSKILVMGFNSFQLAGLLYLGAALAMLPYLFKQNSSLKLPFQKCTRLRTMGIIFFGGILGPLLLLTALKTSHAASVSIWLNMELVATALLGVFIFKDSLDRYSWIGVALTVFAGVLTSLSEGISGLASGSLITAACLCWSIDNHLTSLTDGVTPETITFIKGTVAGLINLIIGCLISVEPFPFPMIIPAVIIGMFSYGFSMVLYVTSAQNIGATRSQILFSTAPLWGVGLSYILYQESFCWEHIISLVLLAAAVFFTSIQHHKHLHNHGILEHIHYHQHNDEHHVHIHHLDGESTSSKNGHSHAHTHSAVEHSHPHYPDLHHRHGHK